jgi:hypothetical protein
MRMDMAFSRLGNSLYLLPLVTSSSPRRDAKLYQIASAEVE